MEKTEKIALTILGIAAVAFIAFVATKGGSGIFPDVATDDVGISQDPADSNQEGPSYLVASAPWGYGPPVTMQAPVTSQGFQGQVTPVRGT